MLLDKVPQFERKFSTDFLEGRESTDIREDIKRNVKRAMRSELFYKVKREKLVAPPTRMVYEPCTGLYRRRTESLDILDVPKRYLDVEGLVPDLDTIVESIHLGASRLAMETRIKEVSAESTEAEA